MYEVVRTVTIAVIGCGGIMDARDVIQFLSLGARAVQVGTASLIDPARTKTIVKELGTYYGKKM